MIIDLHAHAIMPTMRPDEADWYKKEATDNTEELLKAMDTHGVDKAVLLHTHCSNEQIQSVVKKHPDRFVCGFCSWRSEKFNTGRDAAEEIEKWLKEPEFKGVGECLLYALRGAKGIEATLQDVMREARVVMDVVAANKVPIIFHTGFSGAHTGKSATPIMWKDPIYLDELAIEYPDTPIIIGHTGGPYPPHNQNALMIAYNHDNVYLDTSKSRTSDVIEQVVKEIGSSRILFGSDWIQVEPLPFGPRSERRSHLYDRNILVVKEARISDEDKENIFYKNLKRLLNL